MASTKYQDNRGRTVMHVAAEQVCVCVCVCTCVCVYFTTVMIQGCAKQVNIIRSVRPTSVQDFDKQGYIGCN